MVFSNRLELFNSMSVYKHFITVYFLIKEQRPVDLGL
jgi:hypothetical protein